MLKNKLRNTPHRYGLVAQGFHWLIVLLIVIQYQMGKLAEDLPLGMDKLIMMSRHKSLGITILALAVARLVWRIVDRPPAPPRDLHAGLRKFAAVTHFTLYGLLFALPLTGWLTSSFANSAVSWWGWLTLPDLVAPNKARFELLGEVHGLLTRMLIVVVAVHATAALIHHFVLKDTVLRRMLPGWPEPEQ